MNKALFLDRDGTLIEHKPYLHKPEDVVLLPGTIEGLKLARQSDYMLFLFTNQSGIGRGYFTLEDVQHVHVRMLELIGLGPDIFTDVCIAPEHPDKPSEFRKPSPRFILEMLVKHRLSSINSWMIGDSPVDWLAGRAAGIRFASIAPASHAIALLEGEIVTSAISLAHLMRAIITGCELN